MKKEFVGTLIRKLQDKGFSQLQLEEIKNVLEVELHGLNLSPATDNSQAIRISNSELLNSFISAKRVEGCSEKTLMYYRNTIQLWLATIKTELKRVTTDAIRRYLATIEFKNKVGKVTIDNIRRILSSFFSWLEDEDYVLKSPVRRIHKIRTEKIVRETISDEQLEQLRDSCQESRDLALIDFLASTGVRVGELVKINRTDINFTERQCVVLGKGNKERLVYFNARAKVHLQNYLNSRKDNNVALFVSLSAPHKRLTISGVENRLKSIGEIALVKGVHPHKFRRTLATTAIDKGMPIEQVQRLLGHCKIDTTLHYAMVNQNNVKIAHRRYLS